MATPPASPPQPTQLRTARLLLRPPAVSDAEAYFQMASNPEFAVFGARRPANMDVMRRAMERIVAIPWGQRAEFAVERDGMVIGRLTLEIDRVNLVATLGYGIAREHWGHGLATEAAAAVTGYVFETLGLEKVVARVDPRNVASVRVLEKLGMQREGLLRSQVVRWGERADRAIYGLLRADWAGRNGDPIPNHA
ncbi:MAG: GNAT family N-acetyltransferase [Chloroflexi bacterium]|nr:GNAT family N-acetyltransferase [Chloroflexota bacterium]